MTALAAVGYFKARSPEVAVVARELALVMADGEYAPDFFSHLPGVANYASDMLSRQYQPGFAFKLPGCLAHATSVTPGKRSAEWFLSLRPPSLW